MTTERRVLAISAHPDDADISSGGTIAQWVKEGRPVIYVICTNGDKGSGDPEMTSERLAPIREAEQRKAAAMLGIKELVFLNHSDGLLEDTPPFRRELVRMIRFFRPETVLAPDPHRRPFQHRDHRITGIVTLDACYPYARDRLSYPEHLAEGLSPHKVREAYLWGTDAPNTFVDISETFDLKVAALRCHASQFAASAIEEWMRQMATRLGEGRGLALAEAFHRFEFRW